MPVNLEKRRVVMERSRRLGHCICDPRKPCPCDVFTGQGLCPCAGERPDTVPAAKVRLTEMARNSGCASKIAAADLEAMLGALPKVNDPNVLCGLDAGDDAGVYRIAPNLCLVQTVDVMTPCVDDARTFVRICAVNCLSDIYAMGGTPRTALSILAYPAETHSGDVMTQMMLGAMEALAEANVALIGGHSIKDEEVKLGFAITGTIDPAQATFRNQAHPGDQLVLTKPLGTGVLGFCRQIGRTDALDFAAAEASMLQSNRDAAEAMAAAGASACVDITGFGLFGHLVSMLRHSGVAAEITAEALPAFGGALRALGDGVVPGAIERNREFVGADLAVSPGVNEAIVHLGFDAQTSGGLLIAIAPAKRQTLVNLLTQRGVQAFVVGQITPDPAGRIAVVSKVRGSDSAARIAPMESRVHAVAAASPAPACCAEGVQGGGGGEAPAVDTPRAFGAFMRAASSGGTVDARSKELITFALTLLARCEPCVKAHLAQARKMGLTQAELDEAAWCAVAMGGAPVKMLYEQALKGDNKTHGSK
jgi:selenide, water dikinase